MNENLLMFDFCDGCSGWLNIQFLIFYRKDMQPRTGWSGFDAEQGQCGEFSSYLRAKNGLEPILPPAKWETGKFLGYRWPKRTASHFQLWRLQGVSVLLNRLTVGISNTSQEGHYNVHTKSLPHCEAVIPCCSRSVLVVWKDGE